MNFLNTKIELFTKKIQFTKKKFPYPTLKKLEEKIKKTCKNTQIFKI